MVEAKDSVLTGQYADHQSETAFTELVRRHINLVYSVAFRFTGNSTDAQDITQAVFVILARKAANLRRRDSLTGWLYEVTRLTARQHLRTRARQQARDHEAYMQSTFDPSGGDPLWLQLAPHLEDAMARLSAADRELLALRFYENKTGAEAAALLGIGAEAAHKRTARALDRLQKFFAQRGIRSTTAMLAGALSANSVHAAPAGLAKAVSVIAVAKGAVASTATLTLVTGALKPMAWTKIRTTVVAGMVALLAGSSIWIIPDWVREWRDSKIDYRVEGTLDFSVNGEPGAHKDFIASVKSDKWLIRFPLERNGIDYQEDAFDGENVYRYTQFQKSAVPDRNNSSTGIVEANDIPDLGGSTDQTTPVWLAYGAAHYFEGITGNRLKSFFFVNRPGPELEQGPYMDAEWKLSAKPPSVPAYIYFPKLNYRYRVLQFTNFDGLSVPGEFLLEYFGPGRELTNLPVVSMHGFLTKISKLNARQDFRPKLDGRTYTEDRRFAGNAANYINTSADWFSTNSPQWQALSKMYNPKAGGLVWPRNHRGITWP